MCRLTYEGPSLYVLVAVPHAQVSSQSIYSPVDGPNDQSERCRSPPASSPQYILDIRQDETALCIYKALYLNVPANTRTLEQPAIKTKSVVTGLLAPEVVLYLAPSQLIEARRLARELQNLLRRRKPCVEAGAEDVEMRKLTASAHE
jgi:hypothetical protein